VKGSKEPSLAGVTVNACNDFLSCILSTDTHLLSKSFFLCWMSRLQTLPWRLQWCISGATS